MDDMRNHAPTTKIVLMHEPQQPPNLSALWNIGFDIVKAMIDEQDINSWYVAMFNDDTVIPGDWYDLITQALVDSPAVVGCGSLHPSIHSEILKTQPDRDPMTRMCPHAFVVRGECDLRADERLQWWWGDTDFDWQARVSGGVLIIPQNIAVNTLANSSTVGVLAEQAGRDRAMFAQKWGYNPW
jgi:hypothetical protein